MNPFPIEGPKESTGVDVRCLLASESLSLSLRKHVEKIDVDGDGMISMDELLKVLETERMLRRERTLLVRIIIALAIMCVLIVAAVVGLTYAVVHLSKDTNVQNNVLVSKDTAEPISTASMQATYPLKDWYKVQSMSELEGLTQITVPFGDGISIFTIQDIHLFPNESVRFDTSSEDISITVSKSGIFVTGDEKNSSASRRRLLSDEQEGTVTGQVITTPGGQRDEVQFCRSKKECWTCGYKTMTSTYSECCKSGNTDVFDQVFFETGDPKAYCKYASKNGQQCLDNIMCESKYCKGINIFKAGVCTSTTKEAGEPCESGVECANKACGRPTAADGATLQCCASGTTSTYAGYDYCGSMPVNSVCWSNSMCETGRCKDNSGGLKKGTCSSTTKDVGESCASNAECANKACGRPTAADGATLQCCASGTASTYAGYDYCGSMPANSVCWSNAQCLSTSCKGNWFGTRKGNCE